jgi:hypothetical protein
MGLCPKIGAVLDSLAEIPLGLELDWFPPLPVQLGLFWITLSLLIGMTCDRASPDSHLLRVST